MFNALKRRFANRRSSRPTQTNKTSQRRRLRTELLEDRRLLAVGDLVDSLFPIGQGLQSGSNEGQSVAIGDQYIVSGKPHGFANGGSSRGAVEVYDATTQTHLLTIQNPALGQNDFFGHAVAISGNTVVVGAYQGAQDVGIAYVYDLSTGSASQTSTINNPAPGNGDQFGYSVAVGGDTIVIGAVGDDSGAPSTGRAYVYDISSGTAMLAASLSNPTPVSGDRFGNSVAVSGDTIVVGASHDNTGALNAGSAYVYDWSSGSATLVASLNNPTPGADDRYGHSVAVSGDTVVVGAIYDDTGADNAGSAYVYDLSSGSAMLTADLSNPTPGVGDRFGHSVAISGNTVVVSENYDNAGASNAGSAHVYDLSSGTALLATTLHNPTPQSGDQFGSSVAIRGTAVVVGAIGDNTAAPSSGSAYVFDLSSGSATLEGTLNNPTPNLGNAFDQFGSSVAISGDTMVVGAIGDDIGAPSAGSAYIYDLSTGSTSLIAKVSNPAPASGDQFGWSVAVSGNTVVIGASGDDTGASNAGSVYVYELNSGTPSLVATISNPTPADQDRFGVSVAVSGDSVVIGANGDDAGGSNAGSAYVYDLSSGSATLTSTIINPSSTANGDFGGSVAISGNTAVIGARYDGNQSGAGNAYVYDLTGGSAALAAIVNNPAPNIGDQFGGSVAVSGNNVIIGASFDDTGANNSGSAYLYDLSSGSAALVATITNPTLASEEYFGSSVAVSGDTVVIGAFGTDGIVSNQGTVYVYDISSGSAAQAANINNPTPGANDQFGASVGVSGDKVVAGALGNDLHESDMGAAYIFEGIAPNSPPTAIDDLVTTEEDDSVTFSVLADNGNGADSDPDGNLDPSKTIALFDPAGGVLFNLGDGSFRYEPNPGFSGSDFFAYQIEDASGATASAEVHISVTAVNSQPQFDEASYNFNLDENSDIDSLVDLVAATDGDADALVYSIVAGNTGNAFKIDPSTGAISVDNGLAIDYEVNPTFELVVQVDDKRGFDNSTNTANVTITLNDLQTTISISDAIYANVSQEAFGEANFQVTASGDPLGFGFDVAYETINSTASSDAAGIGGNDYVAQSGTLSFAGLDGEFFLVDVLFNDDSIVEGTEYFYVQLLSVSGSNDVTILDATGLGTIVDDDSATITLGNASVVEGDTGANTLSFPVTLSQIADANLTFDYRTQDDSAITADGDYIGIESTTFIIPAGSAGGQIDVVVSGDQQVELDESLMLLADNLQVGGRNIELVGTGSGGTFSVLDDFQASTSGNVINGVTASNGQTWSADALFVLAQDPADASNIVLTNSSSVSSDKTALLPLSDTGTGTENTVTLYYRVKAAEVSGYSTGVGFYDGVGTANQLKTAWTQLVDGPGIRALGANPPQDVQAVSEDEWYDVWLVVDLADDSNPQTNDRMKAYVAGPGIDGQVPLTHGDGAGDEFRFNSYDGMGMTDLILFAHGGGQSASQFYLDSFYIDSTGENLSSPLAGVTATGTIINDDSVTLTVGDATVTEGDSGATTLSFPVTLSQPVDVDVTFDYQTQDGTATLVDGDYEGIATPASFTIAAGSTVGQIDIVVQGDDQVELDESLQLVVSHLNASGREVQFADTVIDQSNLANSGSASPSSALTWQQEVIVAESGQLTGLTVYTSGAGDFNLSINLGAPLQSDPDDYSTMVTATAAGAQFIDLSEANLHLVAGERFAFKLNGINDGPQGGFRTSTNNSYAGRFYVNGSQRVSTDFIFQTHMTQVGIASMPAAGTIINDDQASLAVSSITQSEDGVFEFTVTTDKAVSEDITFAWGTFETPGQANYDTDFARVAIEPATIPAGSLSTNFRVDVFNDNVEEPDEFFRVQIYNEGIAGVASPTRVTIGERHAIGMILNDDRAPVADAGGPYVIDEGSSLALDATASSDLDGDLLTYRWDVDGDGDFDENVTGATQSLTWTQLVDLGINNGPDGPRSVFLEVSDGANSTTATQSLTVNNVAPVAADDTFGTSEEDTLTVTAPGLLGNDSDANSLDTLSIVGLDLSGTRGIVNVNSDGTFTYDPDGKFEFLSTGETKNETFIYTLSDSDADTDTATATITITGVNDAPYVFNLDPTASEDGPAISIPAIFNDERFDTHTFSIDTTGTLGSVTNNADGTFSYDPNGVFESLAEGQTAGDSFTYTVTDNHGAAATGTVTLTIVGQNDAPAALDDSIAATEDGAIMTTVPLVSDVDGDDDASSLAITITTQPSAGSATVNTNGTLNFDPGADFQQLSLGETKQVSFEFSATDQHGAVSNTGTVTVMVTGTNDAPYVFNLDPSVSEDGPAISIPAIFNDERFDTHTFSIDTSGTLGAVTNNLDGTFSYNPDGAFESLAEGQTASDSFTYTVTDNHGAAATGTVELTITGENDLATISGANAGAVQEDSTTGASGTLTVSDVDVGESVFEIADLTGEYGSFTIDADGLWSYQLDNSTVQFLNDGEFATDTFSVSSIDGTASELVTITVEGGTDSDTDGVDDSIEAGAGDGNGDGIADSEQDNVASLPNAVSQSYVTIAAASGATLTQVATTTSPSSTTPPPVDVDFPIGFLQFTVSVPNPGDAAEVTLFFDAGEVFNSVYKFGPTATDPSPHYYEFSYDPITNTGAEFFSDRVVLHLVDGGTGDADGMANGLISDPVSLALVRGQVGDDFVTTLEDQNLTFNPLGNDTLSADQAIVSVTTTNFGNVEINGDGTLTYTPDSGFSGVDSFEYTVSTGTGQTETAEVVIEVKNLVDVPAACLMIWTTMASSSRSMVIVVSQA